MTPSATDEQAVLDLARKLPTEARERIAHELLDELAMTEPAPPRPDHVRQAWKEEIARRIAAYQRGEVRTLTTDEVIAQLDAALAEERRNADRNRS